MGGAERIHASDNLDIKEDNSGFYLRVKHGTAKAITICFISDASIGIDIDVDYYSIKSGEEQYLAEGIRLPGNPLTDELLHTLRTYIGQASLEKKAQEIITNLIKEVPLLITTIVTLKEGKKGSLAEKVILLTSEMNKQLDLLKAMCLSYDRLYDERASLKSKYTANNMTIKSLEAKIDLSSKPLSDTDKTIILLSKEYYDKQEKIKVIKKGLESLQTAITHLTEINHSYETKLMVLETSDNTLSTRQIKKKKGWNKEEIEEQIEENKNILGTKIEQQKNLKTEEEKIYNEIDILFQTLLAHLPSLQQERQTITHMTSQEICEIHQDNKKSNLYASQNEINYTLKEKYILINKKRERLRKVRNSLKDINKKLKSSKNIMNEYIKTSINAQTKMKEEISKDIEDLEKDIMTLKVEKEIIDQDLHSLEKKESIAVTRQQTLYTRILQTIINYAQHTGEDNGKKIGEYLNSIKQLENRNQKVLGLIEEVEHTLGSITSDISSWCKEILPYQELLLNLGQQLYRIIFDPQGAIKKGEKNKQQSRERYLQQYTIYMSQIDLYKEQLHNGSRGELDNLQDFFKRNNDDEDYRMRLRQQYSTDNTTKQELQECEYEKSFLSALEHACKTQLQ